MPWQIVSGVVDWWADEGLREVGRRRRARDAGTIANAQRIAGGTLSIARAAFIAQREPWRLTEVTLLDEGLEPTAPVIASWADEASAVLRGKPAEQHVVARNECCGDLCVGVMLKPAALRQLVPEPWPERFVVDGLLLEHDPSLLPELLSWSTDRYEVVFDRSREILTSWTAIIDGKVAQRITLSRLTALGP